MAEVLPSEEFIERSIAPVVVDALQNVRAVALLGARQAAKSTLARVLARGPIPADYLTLDSDPVRAAAQADPEGFVAALGRSTVIDDVQRAPDLLLAVKGRLDCYGRHGRSLLTGSANLRRIPAVADALPGRVDYLTLWLRICRGGPAGEIAADTRTLASRTARTRR